MDKTMQENEEVVNLSEKLFSRVRKVEETSTISNSAQEFEDGFGHLAHAAVGEFRQVDRDHRPHRHGERQGDDGGDQGARDQHHDAEVGIIEQRRPLRVSQEIDQWNVGEELDGL